MGDGRSAPRVAIVFDDPRRLLWLLRVIRDAPVSHEYTERTTDAVEDAIVRLDRKTRRR